MRPIPLEAPDRRLGAPDDYDHAKNGICHTLEIWDRGGFMISAWQPSLAQLAKLNAGEPLFLHIAGSVHPVVALSIGYEKA